VDRDVLKLFGIFAVSGVLHFAIPKPYESIVPKPLPYKRELVYVSGVAELGCAALLTRPSTRRLAGILSFGLLLAVFPANVQMTISTWQSRQAPLWWKIATVLRLPLQIPPLRWALTSTKA
jgi:uncharacterized membrane protein